MGVASGPGLDSSAGSPDVGVVSGPGPDASAGSLDPTTGTGAAASGAEPDG
ncbi:hypothetical protein [Streptomyces sp. NPDC050535]|uniref:hypothetical protein n=1 Tax=Streptomyces sp. NPDC050535 TaxID=3365626 RepID=UPI003796A0A3